MVANADVLAVDPSPVVLGRIGGPVRGVNLLALRQEGELGEAVGVLAAHQSTQLTVRRRIDVQRAAIARTQNQPFGCRGNELAVHAQDVSIRAEEQNAVEKAAHASGRALIDADRHIGPGFLGRAAELIGRLTRHLDAVLEEVAIKPLHGFIGRIEIKPIRMARDKTFGEGDNLRSVTPRLLDQAARLIDGRFAVERHRLRLNGRCLEFRETVATHLELRSFLDVHVYFMRLRQQWQRVRASS